MSLASPHRAKAGGGGGVPLVGDGFVDLKSNMERGALDCGIRPREPVFWYALCVQSLLSWSFSGNRDGPPNFSSIVYSCSPFIIVYWLLRCTIY
jgi:hypothetical protein